MTHRPAYRHGELEQVFDDVWSVTGEFPMGPGLRIPRNMTIVRDGDRLVLVNGIRLTAEGEAALEKLGGKVTDVVRLAGGHGSDDPYLAERYGATMWAPAGITKPGLTYQALDEETSPLSDGKPFIFKKGKFPDAAIVLARHGGILISCDAYQHWTAQDQARGSFLGRIATKVMGFSGPVIGGPWAKRMGPAIHDDFVRLCEQPFEHLLTGHGSPLRDRARDELTAAMKKFFKR
jgi:hypothetical protein